MSHHLWSCIQRQTHVLAAFVALMLSFPSFAGTALAADELYQQQVQPVLRERCVACHGALRQEGGLRLDTAALLRQGGETGPAAKPGDSASSLLLARVSAADLSERMPPEGEPLKPEQINAIRRWIDAGAQGPPDERPEESPQDHWAFRAPQRPQLPSVADSSRIRTPIDTFIQAARESRQLTAQPPADPRTWLRRVSIDLVGLPPTLQEQEQFLADPSPEARAKVIDRLLASPQYGERWGRHWMDIWRYSDWWGLGAEVRNSQKHIWHWRDWIIESLNNDAGYDQMLQDMLAADELHPADSSRLRATGFLARQYFKFNRTSWLDETVQHTFKAMLGMTFNCCKCHDHKYDPVSQREYYQLRAFFEPYQVRTDLLPGIASIEENGIPRAFDCNLDVQTFLHIRGDDRNPDLERPLPPAIPAFLAFEQFPVEPVRLPLEAARPQLRPELLDALRKSAASRIEQTQGDLVSARAAVEEAAKREAAAAAAAALPSSTDTAPAAPEVLATDTFEAPNPELWLPRSGEWKWENKRLQQLTSGAADQILELRRNKLPADFEAVTKFTTISGQMWKSVGLRFDVAGDNNVMVYLSSYAGGPKVQLAWKQNGQQAWPEDAVQPRDVPLGQPQELTVRVRGRLINVLVNGQLAIVSRLPFERREGPLQLIAFDAVAEFHHFELRTLPASAAMQDAATGPEPGKLPSLAQAQATLGVAEAAVARAAAEPELLEAKIKAERAAFQQPDSPETAAAATHAAQLERHAAVLAAVEAAARAALNLLNAVPGKQAEAEKQSAAATEALNKARAAAEQPASAFTPLVGSVKTLENNLESEDSRRKPFPTTSTGRRSALARWIASPRNPLTARVAVNHIWMRHFGRGLVSSVFDFGRRGARPTHPELLDWLAVEFMENGWSMKHLHRLILLSDAWGLSTSPASAQPKTASADPENIWYWRANSGRMEAQIVRDSLLSLAGQLDLTLGGPSIPVASEDSRRRSLYFVHSHNEHQKFLSLFDDASVLECYRRADSIVPQQALALENSPLAINMAEQIATQLQLRNPELTDERFTQLAFLTVLASEPSAEELSVCVQALAELRTAAPPGSNPDNVARRALVQTLINQHDFITIR